MPWISAKRLFDIERRLSAVERDQQFEVERVGSARFAQTEYDPTTGTIYPGGKPRYKPLGAVVRELMRHLDLRVTESQEEPAKPSRIVVDKRPEPKTHADLISALNNVCGVGGSGGTGGGGFFGKGLVEPIRAARKRSRK